MGLGRATERRCQWARRFFPSTEERRVLDFAPTRDGWQLQVPSLLMLLEAYCLLRVPHSRPLRLVLAAATWAVYIYSLTQYRVHIPLEGMGRGGQPALFGLFWCMQAAVQMIRAAEWACLSDAQQSRRYSEGESTTVTGTKGNQPDLSMHLSASMPEWDLMLNVRRLRRGRRLRQVCQMENRTFWAAKLGFAVRRALYGLWCLLLVDIVDCIKVSPLVYPPAPSAEPATIWAAREGALGWAGPYVMSLCIATAVNMLVQGVFSLMSAVYALVHPDPDLTQWSPLPVYRLGLATSLGALWGKHWHQMLRQVFIFAARVGRRVSRPLGRRAAGCMGVLFAFAVSGLAHEWGQLHMRTPGYPHQPCGPTLLFFLGQGALVLAEQAFTAATGVPVCGPLGWLWTNISLLTLGTLVPMDVRCSLSLMPPFPIWVVLSDECTDQRSSWLSACALPSRYGSDTVYVPGLVRYVCAVLTCASVCQLGTSAFSFQLSQGLVDKAVARCAM